MTDIHTVIYEDNNGRHVALYDNVGICFVAVKQFLKSCNIYDEELQNALQGAQCINELIEIIDKYNIDSIEIIKTTRMNKERL